MPEAALETELKFDLPPDAALPRLHGAGPIARVGPARRMTQTATYYDTPDLALLAAKCTLRRRTGGTDAGWHLKTPGPRAAATSGGQGAESNGALLRREHHEPPGSARSQIPTPLRALVADIVGRELLMPVCVLRTVRVRRELLGADGAVLALVEDDSVQAWRPGADSEIVAWREIEVELVAPADGGAECTGGTESAGATADAGGAEGAGRDVLAAVVDVFAAAGLTPGRSPSKLARALEGLGLTPGPSVAVPADASIAADLTGARVAVWRYMAAQVGVIQALTAAVADDEPDAVHKMRVATRRLRATLRTIRPWLDKDATQRMRVQVRWLTRTLAGARDGEVVRERILAELDELPRRDVRGPVRRRLRRELDATHAQAHAVVVQALASARYERLLDTLVHFLQHLPWRERSRRTLHDLLMAATRRVQHRAQLADEAPTPALREYELHEVRKKGKAARYAVEAATKFAVDPDELVEVPDLEPGAAGVDEAVAGRLLRDPSDELAAWVELQELLGDHQDAVVARDVLRRLAATAHAAGEDTYSYGVLVGRETQRLTDNTARIEAALARALDPGVEDDD